MIKRKKIYTIFIVCLLIILGSFIRMGFLAVSDNAFKTDTQTRILNAVEWTEEPYFFTPDERDWLPFHFHIMGIVLKITKDPILMPRLISLFFGIFTLWPFYKLIKIIFDERIAIYSLFLFCFYPMHILLSSVSLSEVIYLFFLIKFFHSFILYIKSFRIKDFILSIIFLILASMTRYEAWLYSFWAGVILFLERTNIKNRFKLKLTFFMVFTLLFPVAWMLHFEQNLFTEKYAMVSRDLPHMSHYFNIWENRFIYWQSRFFSSFGFLFSLFFIAGMLASLREKKTNIRYYIVAFSMIILFFITGLVTKVISADSCYSLTFDVLVIPVAFYGITRIFTDRFLLRKTVLWIVIFFTLMTFRKEVSGEGRGLSLDFPYLFEANDIITPPMFDDSVHFVASYLADKAYKDSNILIDQQQPETYYIHFFLKKNDFSKSFVFFYDNTYYHETKKIIDRVKKYNPDYIVHYNGDEPGFFKDNIVMAMKDYYKEILRDGEFIVYQLIEG